MTDQPDSIEAARRTWADDDIQITLPESVDDALVARGVTASGVVVAREGLPDGLEDVEGAVGRLLGEDGLGQSFDALVATGAFDKTALLALAVERSYDFYGVPAVLASGEAQRWAETLPDDEVEDMFYHEAPAAFESAQADAVVASARARLREQVHGG